MKPLTPEEEAAWAEDDAKWEASVASHEGAAMLSSMAKKAEEDDRAGRTIDTDRYVRLVERFAAIRKAKGLEVAANVTEP